ncbi:MAG: GDP-mannose 4,6-dehydratase [Candidatus Infernicultor aquiphilus]|uniref:GDP-mannose 4,6-dehydratase n=1 Tax=Candidatus Infernicultor aquiphilus TaxID=1805029 RepID=A0A2M7PN31_9BACT|nr:MAG: GDP-mannose 4,6-dehydratase [Candidatus Atribacteria bacterium CG_4_10_14_3_um_filter_34_13]
MKKALITGGEGFVGGHLRAELEDNGYQVISTSRLPKDGFVKMDIKNYEEIRSVLNEHKPDVIFHLAAIAYVPSSWQDPELVYEINGLGTVKLLNAARSLGLLDTIVQIAGSSEEYGLVTENETLIKETNPLRPLSPYAISKISADLAGYQHFKSWGIKTIRTRAFNHEGPESKYGPARGDEYVTSTFAKQVALIEKGKQDKIMVGDLTSIRDFTDVRDTVRAYRLLIEKGEYGEVYNIGSGKGYTIQQVLDILIKLAKAEIKVEVDPKRLRPSDVKLLLCDCSKMKKITGWEPEIPFEKTMEDLLNYWRKVV